MTLVCDPLSCRRALPQCASFQRVSPFLVLRRSYCSTRVEFSGLSFSLHVLVASYAPQQPSHYTLPKALVSPLGKDLVFSPSLSPRKSPSLPSSSVATMTFSAKAVLGASLSAREAKRALRQVLLSRRNSLHRARLVCEQSGRRFAQVCDSEKENGGNCMQAPDAVSGLHASEMGKRTNARASAASPCMNAEGGVRGRDTSQRGKSGEEEGVLVSRALSESVNKHVCPGSVSPRLSTGPSPCPSSSLQSLPPSQSSSPASATQCSSHSSFPSPYFLPSSSSHSPSVSSSSASSPPLSPSSSLSPSPSLSLAASPSVSPSFGEHAASSFSSLPEFPDCMRLGGGMRALNRDRDTGMQFTREEQGEEDEERRRKMTGRFRDLLGAVYPHIVHPDGQLRAGKTPLVVSGYSPIGSELDSTFLLSLAESLGHACALPCIEEKRAPLTFRQWFCGMPLVPGKFNIPAPQADCRHPVVEPDVVLVPLLGFDRLGRRLGYGGGYYDRTLCELRRRRGTHDSPRRKSERDSFGPVGPLSERLRATQPPRHAAVPLLVCGVAFDCQEVDEIPTEGFDQPLDCVLLENDLKLFSPELADKFQ
ncbi:UNVERIFIED_CONTAM: 5-formyltetrahydrofolate cyclo-ligase [Hammondia hammondi]|eukprot:XP_008886882.1 5-formyltetrahydrofolate cyclo-ligase [Hammondia hammondi]